MKAIFTFSSSSLSSPIIMERTLLVALLTLFGAGMIALYGVPGFLKLELFPIPALRAGFVAWSRDTCPVLPQRKHFPSFMYWSRSLMVSLSISMASGSRAFGMYGARGRERLGCHPISFVFHD
jgi:hypothetical protein